MQTVNMAMIGGATAAGILSAAIAAVCAAFVGWQIGKAFLPIKGHAIACSDALDVTPHRARGVIA